MKMTRTDRLTIGGILMGCLVAWATMAAVIINVHYKSIRSDAQEVIDHAVERMQAVGNFDDPGALLSACESGTFVDVIDCRLGDYDVVYKGHRSKFATIEIDYYRTLHSRYDRERGRYLPYLTATVHIERHPQVQLVGFKF
jgi:hypothetical protein